MAAARPVLCRAGQHLARIETPLGVECLLHVSQHGQRDRINGLSHEGQLHAADAVFAAQHPAVTDRHAGDLLRQGKVNLDAWWIIFPTFAVLVLTMLLLTFIGDALRDAFDTRKS